MQQDSNEESWLENQCHQEINARHEECEREYVHHRDSSISAVWGAFQDSATAVAHLYRERSANTYPDTGALWLPFQTAAGTVTSLYKESCEGIKRSSDAAANFGYQRRSRELVDWARSKKRRMIRREDLIAYLAGKAPTSSLMSTPPRRSPKPEQASVNANINSAFSAVMSQQTPPMLLNTQPPATMNETANDLHTFKEVLKPRGPELFAFVASEIARHCSKRPASPTDDKMDVCHFGSKRQRFI